MRARQIIFNAVAVAALGAMCMAQSGTASQTQGDDQQSAGQSVTRQESSGQQQNETKRDAPASMSSESKDSDVSRANESGDPRAEADPRTRLRIEEIEKLTVAQQNQQ